MAPTRPLTPPTALAVFTLLAAVLSGCKEGESSQSAFNPVVAPAFANQGCNGPGVSLAAPSVVFTDGALIGNGSHIVATSAIGDDQLYLTGDDGSIHELVFPAGGGAPTDTVILAAGAIESQYLVPNGIMAPASISGLTLLDPATLLVIEETSNSILMVRLVLPVTVLNFAGVPSITPGFSDLPPGLMRFSFTGPTQILANPAGEVYVADPGNHALRELFVGTVLDAATLAGTGSPFYSDGPLSVTGFDTPTGLSISCGGEILVTELGASGLGGHRLRSIGVGDPDFFGDFTGNSSTLAGDGTPTTTEGIDTLASSAAPMSPVSTESEILWMDSATGILRRHDLTTGENQCPLFADCDDAVMAGGSFTPGAVFSMTLGASGTLYVLDGSAGTISTVSM